MGFSADFELKGIYFRVFGSSEFPNTFKEKQDSQMQTQKKSSQYTPENEKFFIYCRYQTSLIQSNQRACLAQTGDE
jgi:hypothetical protein